MSDEPVEQAEDLDEGFRAALAELEDYLEGMPDERLAELVLPFASRWALHDSGLDIARYRAEAEVFVQATPFPDRILAGYAEQVAWWLGQRMLLDEQDAPRPPEEAQAVLDGARAAVARRAGQVEAAGYPRVAEGFRRVLAGSQGAPPDDPLWEALALRIAETLV
ncbi:MAG TPA: hypothetical protein VLN26_02330 [Gaiellaceae bacterium]|nr:hypothetical protein [Gaiellaceae bacterium]